MQLLVQPDNGIFPILKAIQEARRTVDMHIFRLAYKDVEKALAAAVHRGVVVRTLIAHTNASGEKSLRKLEQRLLEIGATVSRTADDLVRYHGKILIVDGSWLFVLAFNLTHRDIDRSRTIGVATRKRKLVQEAVRLFEADFDRKPYSGGAKDFLVSPVNARERLAAFLRGARKQLLIYDQGITDNAMIRILQDRAKAGVDLRIIGKVEKGHDPPRRSTRRAPAPALHRARQPRAFLGSQSLRRLELDARREIGVIVKDPKVVRHRRDVRVRLGGDRGRAQAGQAGEGREAGRQGGRARSEEGVRRGERVSGARGGGERWGTRGAGDGAGAGGGRAAPRCWPSCCSAVRPRRERSGRPTG
jgi:phosphatidylserine/phosphatidylglycerophosphate/cardiolipin synthase-like enzyme